MKYLLHVTTWINFEKIMLSQETKEINKKNTTGYMIAFILNVQKRKINRSQLVDLGK